MTIGRIVAAIIGYVITALLIFAAGVGVWRLIKDNMPEGYTREKVKEIVATCMVLAAVAALLTSCATGI